MDLRKLGYVPKVTGVNSLGPEIEPSLPKDDPTPSGQGNAASSESKTLEGYKQLMEYLEP